MVGLDSFTTGIFILGGHHKKVIAGLVIFRPCSSWLFIIRKINLIGQTVEGCDDLAGHYKIMMAGLE